MTVAATQPVAPASSAGSSGGASATDQSDRFLKLLVTQMQNQDPLNPMDNAQVTTQLAQISTVSGIDKLTSAVNAIGTSFAQSQALQAASLVGRNVQIAGNDLRPDDTGRASAAFELAGSADSVVVSVRNAAGQVIDTIDLGAQAAGRHGFTWQAQSGSAAAGSSFSVTARSGAAAVTATPLVSDRVGAVSADGGQLSLETDHHGVVRYADVKAVS